MLQLINYGAVMSDTLKIAVVLSCILISHSVFPVHCIECYLGDYYPNEQNPAQSLETVKCSKMAKSCDVTYTKYRPPLDPEMPGERWHYGCGRGRLESGCHKLKVLGGRYEQYCFCDTDLCLPNRPQFPNWLYGGECDEDYCYPVTLFTLPNLRFHNTI